MKNLLKCTLGIVAATVAFAALASAAVAATPELSPVPTECTGACTSEGSFGSGKGGFGTWTESRGAKWNWTGTTVKEGVTFNSWNEGTTIEGLRVTFENNLCKNEGNNFTTEPLKGRFGVVEGKAVVLLEPETGSTIGKCTKSGSAEELTGSLIAWARTSPEYLELEFAGESITRLMPNEEEHVIKSSIEGGAKSSMSWTGTTKMASGRELHIAGRTATFVTPKYAGGFELNGGTMTFQSTNGLKVVCKYTSGSGQFTSATGGYLNLSFTGCQGPLGSTCTGWGSLARLKALLAYTYPATETPEGRQTALVLSPETAELITEVECGGVKSRLKGAVMGVITPLAKSSSTFGLSFKEASGIEEHTQYEAPEGGPDPAILYDSLEGSKWQQSGLEDTTSSIYLNAGGEETIK